MQRLLPILHLSRASGALSHAAGELLAALLRLINEAAESRCRSHQSRNNYNRRLAMSRMEEDVYP